MVADLFAELIMTFGYLGVFFVSLISSASILFPVPGFAVIFTLGSVLNPFLVGLSAALGAALGELVGYYIGYGGEKLGARKKKKLKEKLKNIERLFQKYKGAFIIFVFAATPLPFDLVGLFCGTINYPVKKFFVATLAGKIIKYLLIAYAGALGIEYLLEFFKITG